MKFSRLELANMIDSTLIRSTATKNEVIKLCQEAKKHRFHTAVVNPYYVSLAHSQLKDSTVKVCSTIGFPTGTTLPEIKAQEAQKVVELGAQELDMVINLGALKTKDHQTVKKDIQAVTAIKHLNPKIIVKVIIETSLLTDTEKRIACTLAKNARADYVKTSTGLFSGGATAKDVKLMRQTVGKNMRVKAAGGIRTLKDAITMIEAGADRIGTSTAVQMIEEIPEKSTL